MDIVFKVDEFLSVLTKLESLSQLSQQVDDARLTAEVRAGIKEQWTGKWIVDYRSWGFATTAISLDKVGNLCDDPNATYGDFGKAIGEARGRLIDEAGIKVFIWVEDRHANFFSANEPFGSVVAAQFPKLASDIEEAGKCLALRRYTASVFHLMRVAEGALSAIARRAGLRNPRPGWEEAITYIEGQLNKEYAKMDALFKGDVEFLRGTAAHMRDVNIAWRRQVAHIERSYTEEEAERIYGATKLLMEHIAVKLSDAVS